MRIDRTRRTSAPVVSLPTTITALPIAACSLNAYCLLLLNPAAPLQPVPGMRGKKSEKSDKSSLVLDRKTVLLPQVVPFHFPVHNPVVSDTLTMKGTATHT